ncbi:MAG: deoxyribodipyrimidine photo-lyase, partial [Leptospiraceae bacterium]|nr:deoxyribodipyrimidine photo-lyase [Leptospiraceae bacterium]
MLLLDYKEINLVWIKHDFRIRDNEALALAEQEGKPYVIMILLEPSLMQAKDRSMRYFKLFYLNAIEFNKNLFHEFKARAQILYAELTDVIKFLFANKISISKIFAYEEYSTYATYQRDKLVRKFCKDNQIDFKEISKDCIARGSKRLYTSEEINDYFCHATITKTNLKNSIHLPFLEKNFNLPQELLQNFKHDSTKVEVGEVSAHRVLNSFIEERSKKYLQCISKPYASRNFSSRLSQFLSFGNITSRQVIQAIKNSEHYERNKKNLDAFISRIYWRRHFIQKFEKDCYTYEFQAINPYFNELPIKKNEEFIQRWKTGTTGIPIVDACMRQLIYEGWLNFRMRAMLVSFFCFYLEQDWRDAQYHLAQLFIDYEP